MIIHFLFILIQLDKGEFVTFDPGTTVSRIVEVSDVDGPYGYANDRDDFRQLFTEFVQFLLKGSFDFFSLWHFGSDFTDGGVQTCSDNDTSGFTGCNICTWKRERLFI